MIDREKVTEMLKNYRSYRMAIQNYRNHKAYPAAGVANYSGMPGGSGAPERFFVNPGKMADMGFATALDRFDFEMYSAIVQAVDFTVEQVLSDDEAFVIRRKYLDRNKTSLYQIAIDKDRDESTIRRWHRSALKQLAIALSPIPSQVIPKIENFENARFMPA